MSRLALTALAISLIAAPAAGINQINRTHKVANLGYWVRTSCVQRGVA